MLRVSQGLTQPTYSILPTVSFRPPSAKHIKILKTKNITRHLFQIFGPGWNLPSSEAKVAATNDFSKHWDTNTGGSSFVPTYYLIEKQQHVAVIRFSDTEVYKFKMDVTPGSSRLYPLSTYPMTVRWTPLDDTQGSLEALDYDPTVRYTGGDLWEYGIRPFEPKRFRLTLPDGRAYVLDTDRGLESMTDVYGRTVSYDNDGIHHSSGVSITFTRGAGNRIETITDGWGREVTYHYGADGTLEKVVQEEGGLPGPIRYLGNYACQQGMAEKPVLKEIRAPDGTVLGTFEYDSRDRVIGMLDADGNRVLYGYDLPNHTQTVTDRRNNPTVYEYDNKGPLWDLAG
ncbi:hypothetical protein DENIS_1976 [Desulfonema ishimotonii]|uniref:RHS repeat protein n=1 Tax=Desulfonema ishimotonii TaxID=45657 RepID=A0A401FVL8_9BACT|nr:hypothetical protein DENIS_1976 [Desulfonema ishimotonii]